MRGDRPLFTGRDQDIAGCAALLDQDPARTLLLHSESGAGRSSFPRAGLIPYLEEECAGYRFLRSRREREGEGGDRESTLYVRANPAQEEAPTLVDQEPLEFGHCQRRALGEPNARPEKNLEPLSQLCRIMPRGHA